MTCAVASRSKETCIHDSYIYTISIYVGMVNFDFILRSLTLRNKAVL